MAAQCTQHGGDDYDKIIKGDPGLESIYEWTKAGPAVPFRGATGNGDGVHVLSGLHPLLLHPPTYGVYMYMCVYYVCMCILDVCVY